MKLPLRDLHIDGGTQPRVAINEETVAEYAEALREGATFPPVVAFYDGIVYWLADGFHRFHAHRRAELDVIEVDVHEGMVRDAILYSVGANGDHGLRRTNEDKRKAVLTMLKDDEWSQWSDVEIAKQWRIAGWPAPPVGHHRGRHAGGDARLVQRADRGDDVHRLRQARAARIAPVSPLATSPGSQSKDGTTFGCCMKRSRTMRRRCS